MRTDDQLKHPFSLLTLSIMGVYTPHPFKFYLQINNILYFYLQITDNPDDVCSRSPSKTSPRIAGIPQGDESFAYFLLIENQVIFSVRCFAKAMVFWFASHYVFNLEYCKQAKEVATFFQEFIFDLPERSKNKSATYLTVTSDISKYITEDAQINLSLIILDF